MGKKREKEEEEEYREKKRIRRACCEKEGVRRGAWTAEEDNILVDFITKNGHGTWRNLPKRAGLLRCGKSCRLRWTNYLRPDIKRGPFTEEEENTIIHLHSTLGNKWAAMATHLPGRTDNDIKNFWNSHLRKRFGNTVPNQSSSSSSKVIDMKSESPLTRHMTQWESVRLDAQSRLSAKSQLLNAPSTGKTEGNYFLRLWNSEVGESFRNMNETVGKREGGATHSPNSETSSLTKVESDSKGAYLAEPCKQTSFPLMVDEKTELSDSKKETDEVAAYSDMARPCEFDDSDAMLKLLLDFSVGGNDMGFLEGPSNNVSSKVQDQK